MRSREPASSGERFTMLRGSPQCTAEAKPLIAVAPKPQQRSEPKPLQPAHSGTDLRQPAHSGRTQLIAVLVIYGSRLIAVLVLCRSQLIAVGASS